MGYKEHRQNERRCEILQNGNGITCQVLLHFREVFYDGGCFYRIWDKNTGFREHCDGLISIAYTTNTGFKNQIVAFLPKCFMSSCCLHTFIKCEGNKEVLKCTVILR